MKKPVMILGSLLLCAALADAQQVEDNATFNCERLMNGEIRCWRAEGKDVSLLEKEAELAAMKAYVARWQRYKTALSLAEVQDIFVKVEAVRAQVPDIKHLTWAQVCEAVISWQQVKVDELESALADLR